FHRGSAVCGRSEQVRASDKGLYRGGPRCADKREVVIRCGWRSGETADRDDRLPKRTALKMISDERKSVYLGRFNIGPRLGLCFLVIVLLMLAGYGLLLWQFRLLHIRSDRLTAVGQELIAVSQFQTDFFRLTARLDELAKSEDLDAL